MIGGQAREERVLVLAPSGRDAVLAAVALEREGIAATICPDIERFCAGIEEGAAMGLATEQALGPEPRVLLVRTLERQPLWSDFPLVVLAAQPPTASSRQRRARALAELGNVTVLDRPMHAETLMIAVRAAQRARGRQYQSRELLGRLEEGMRQRDQFLATLSHELRNPLGAIRNATQLLARGMLPTSAAQRPLAIVNRQAQHLSRLVDDLLDVSRVTTGKVVLQRHILDLRAVIQTAVELLRPEMEAHGVRLCLAPGAQTVPVDGDPVRLEQVFTNLLTNAMKYTPRGGQVTVACEADDAQVRVRVVDTGMGIAPEVLPTIFRLFAQADQSLDRSQGGMGIGLTLVRSLLELHGGTVSAASAGLGQGAEFTVTLPLERLEAVQAADGGEERKPGPGRHILLVEDNPDNRESLQELLELEGHHVDIAVDGPQAVTRAVALRPEIAIIDIGLPGMDGFEVARQVRAALGGGILLIALTGYGQPEDRRKAVDAGFNAHVTKPAGLPELEAIVARTGPLPLASPGAAEAVEPRARAGWRS